MCGIAGILSIDAAPPARIHVERMVRAVGHRGPDGTGTHLEGPIALAHARLSIIDVANGHQPMTNEDSSIWITFNGEIFNYVELRKSLEGKGHVFATRSDTEVILHLYEEEGEECVHALNGQWAFAIWDARHRRLFLSRDRIGVRPLFYASVNGQFLFASEIKALLADARVKRQLDPCGLDQIFTFWAPLAPRTAFSDVSELPPGHSLSVDAAGIRSQAYWRPDYGRVPEVVDPDRCADELFELLVDATRIRLRSDVPVGAYLSGGLDSTIIAAIVQRLSTDPLRTFSVTFDDAEFDERRQQDEAVGFLKTEHSHLRCGHGAIANVFPDVVHHAERPILRTAPAPLFMLSKLVRESGHKAVLTGEGADEVFGGYDIFKEAKIRAFWATQPESTRRPQLLKRVYPYLPRVQAQPDAFLHAFFRPTPGPSRCFFSHLPRWQVTSQLKRLFSDELKQQLASYDVYAELKQSLPDGFDRWDYFSRAQYLETAILLPGYILSSQGDRMSMAHAVEARLPFLDHRIVAYASSLPSTLKMKVLDEKYILKRAMGRLVPARIRTRAKQPYRAPDAAAFLSPREGRFFDYVETLLASDRIRRDGVFSPGAVSQLVAKARSGRILGMRDNMAFVGVLSTQLVIDSFMKAR